MERREKINIRNAPSLKCKCVHVCRFVLTSTHVSISENWFMIGRMASMELPERRSDLLPTRMMGILRKRESSE